MGSSTARVTIYDVARDAGVSKSLVSLVLRGSAQVSDARREAVERSIAELGYRPSRAAAALAGQRTDTIGVVIDDFANPWFVGFLAGLREGLAGTAFHVGVADAALNAHRNESPVQGYLAARVDGLIIAAEPREQDVDAVAGGPGQAGTAKAAAGEGGATEGGASRPAVPTVLVGNRRRTVVGADRVSGDDAAGARLAVDHLLGLGHRDIAFLAGRSGPADQRQLGYRRALADAGLPAVRTRPAPTTDEGGYAAMRGLLTAHPQVTAVVAANDLMALGAWQALREAGRSVPADTSLVGYDDTSLAATGFVALTSVDPRSAEQGRLAAAALRARIADHILAPATTLVTPQLVVRSTTAPPPRR